MDISVILPLIKLDISKEEYKKFAQESFESIPEDSKIIIVGGENNINENIDLKGKKNVSTVILSEEEVSMNLQHYINKGVKNCKTEYFSILQVCDLYTKNCFKNADKYLDSDYKSSIMLTLEEVRDYTKLDKGSVGYMNEAVWANGFSEQIGVIDKECIEEFFNFSLFGSVFNKEDYLTVGGLKESMSACYWYEFILRFLQYGKTAFVIPKVGYIVTIGLPSELSMTEEELEFWNKTAKTEYFYKQDRDKTFEG